MLNNQDQDVYAGLFFIALGLLGLYLGTDYAFGTTQRIGPGFMPTLLCWSMVGMGAIVTAVGLLRKPRLLMDEWATGPLIAILCAVLAFTALLERQGLPISVAILVLICSIAMPPPNRLEATLLLIGNLTLLAWLSLGNMTLKSTVDRGVPALSWLFGGTLGMLFSAIAIVCIGAAMLYRLATLGKRPLVEVVSTALVLSVMSVVVFTNALGLPMKVWPEWLAWN